MTEAGRIQETRDSWWRFVESNLKRDERRASPIRDEDIFEVAMERFLGAPGGNDAGVKAVIGFCRNVFRDQADDAHQALLGALKAIRQHRPDHADAVWDQVDEVISKAEAA